MTTEMKVEMKNTIPEPVMGLDFSANSDALVDLVCTDGIVKMRALACRKCAYMNNFFNNGTTPEKIEFKFGPATVAIITPIAEYLEHYLYSDSKEIPVPLKSEKFSDNIPDGWDSKFIETVGADMDLFTEVLLYSNYMVIPSLVELCSSYIGHFIAYNNMDTVCGAFHMKDQEITPEQEEEIIKAHPEFFAWRN